MRELKKYKKSLTWGKMDDRGTVTFEIDERGVLFRPDGDIEEGSTDFTLSPKNARRMAAQIIKMAELSEEFKELLKSKPKKKGAR